MRQIVRRRPRESGQSAVEFALVLIPLLLVVCGCVDFGFIFSNREAVTNAARDGARYATTHPTSWSNASSAPISTIEGQIQNESGTSSITNDDSHILITYMTSSGTTCGHYSASSGSFVSNTGYTQTTCVVAGNLIQVQVTYGYHVLTPLIGQLFSTVNLTSTATMVEEQ